MAKSGILIALSRIEIRFQVRNYTGYIRLFQYVHVYALSTYTPASAALRNTGLCCKLSW